MFQSARPESRVLLVVLFALVTLVLAPPLVGQDTTSSIRVEASNPDGAEVGGVTITITHVPTGRTQVYETNSQGVVTARGLAVGGP